MSALSPDALLSAGVTVFIFVGGCAWRLSAILSKQDATLAKQAEMLVEVRGQIRHNGGSSLKDDARKAADNSVAARAAAETARQLAEQVARDLADQRIATAKDTGTTFAAIKQVQHDVTNVRSGQELLVNMTTNLEAKVDRNNAERIKAQDALAAALAESLHVTVAAATPPEDTP